MLCNDSCFESDFFFPPEGLRGEGRFPIRHWLKKDNQKDIAADSLY